MNVVYLNRKRKVPKTSALASAVSYFFVAPLALVFSPAIAIWALWKRAKCDHAFLPMGNFARCMKCRKKEKRKEFWGIERL